MRRAAAKSVAAFAQKVGDARIHEGIHFRSAVESGNAMGRQIGSLLLSAISRSKYAKRGRAFDRKCFRSASFPFAFRRG
jgi:hypothetical protein